MADWHCKQIPNGQKSIVVCERETLTAEIERLRQGIWDACIALGMDTDGNDTPRHLVYPPLADLIVREAQRARQDYDELLDELSEARRG